MTSARKGFIAPTPPRVPDREAIDDALCVLIAGVCGLCTTLVRPRWQADPPSEPKPDVNWCAFGITVWEGRNVPEVRHHAEGEGYDEVIDHETLSVLLSFYGPQHVDMARLCRRGLHIAQNRAGLRQHGLALTRIGTVTPVPALVAMRWRARADLTLTLQLETRERYDVLNLLQSQGRIQSEKVGVGTGCAACGKNCF